MKAEWQIRLEPQGDATRVSQHFHFMPQGKMPMNAESVAQMTGDEVAANLARLKTIIETQTAQGKASDRPAFAPSLGR